MIAKPSKKQPRKIPVWAGNFYRGQLALLPHPTGGPVLDARTGFDPEVIEMHHRLKQDAPSGTADRLLEILKDSRKLGEDDVSHGRSGMVGERKDDEIGSHALRWRRRGR